MSTTSARVLDRDFYARPSPVVGVELLNKVLIGHGRAGRIVEVEAYLGADDPGSHTFRGQTARNSTMFGPAGHLYVYFTYGMHHCANVVCDQPGVGTAVLLRALAPLCGLDAMRAERGPAARREQDLCSGPAKLCQAFGLDRSFDGVDLVDGPIHVVDDGRSPPARPVRTTRVGLSAGAELPLRWYVPDEPNVSR